MAIILELMSNPEFHYGAWDEYKSNRTGPLSHA